MENLHLTPESPEVSSDEPVVEKINPFTDKLTTSVEADIDPRQWLTHDTSVVTTSVKTMAGRLKIAALDEKETEAARKFAEKPHNPGRPNGPKDINLTKLRCATVAISLNKAYGWTNTPQQINPDEVQKKLSGEITTIVAAISKLSGYEEDEKDEDPGTWFQVS
jgi:hypothetical protein